MLNDPHGRAAGIMGAVRGADASDGWEQMATVGVPPGMAFVRDVPYGEADGEPLLLDLLAPDPLPSSALPAVVWIHGGGWESGDKHVDLADSLGPALVRDGFVSLSINYRLSDRARFPAQLHDAKAAIRWLRSNAGNLGIDPRRIGAWGHSAGGHLAALLGTTGDLADLEGDSGSPGYSSRVQAVVAVSPPTDFLAMPPGWPHAEPRRATSKLVGGPLEERPDLVRLANPIAHIRSGTPPFLIVHGEDDEVVPVQQAELLYEALAAAGNEATFLRLPRTDHALASPARNITARDAWTEVGQRALGFFRAHLHAPER
ncbi:MAG: alpha/beta hydrolase [Chloroflexota bacterium]|nr:alpha/beta hydrolase [Chloroflexota bacterium]